MNKTIIAALLLAPGLALADGPCALERTQVLDFDGGGVEMLQISIGPDSLRLDGGDQAAGSLSVRMCASDQARLDALGAQLVRGDDGRLVLELDHGGRHNVISGNWFFTRSDYGRFEITGAIPARLAVDLTVGSGEAVVRDVAALEAVVGSGELRVERVEGAFIGLVGSGEIKAERTGPTEIGSIGSGSVTLDTVDGDVRIGNIGSGEADVRAVAGALSIGAIGSGEATLADVRGDVAVGALGSGEIDARDIGGGLTLRSKGSGSVAHRNVGGRVNLPNR